MTWVWQAPRRSAFSDQPKDQVKIRLEAKIALDN
jgi:hypothetical protein